MNSFVQKHAAHVIGVLSGFDRVVFRGTIRRLSIVDGMLLFLNVAHVLLRDFGGYVEDVSSRLKKAVTHAMTAAGRPVHYLASSATSKEQLAREIAERDGVTEGPVCLITCVETCQTFGASSALSRSAARPSHYRSRQPPDSPAASAWSRPQGGQDLSLHGDRERRAFHRSNPRSARRLNRGTPAVCRLKTLLP